MRTRYLLMVALMACTSLMNGQALEARIYDQDLFSVQLTLAGAPLTLPIVELTTGPNTLVLEFDHYGPDLINYSYTIRHCDSNWEPSDLGDQEYINGFTEDRIFDVYSSVTTLTEYTHYKVGLPNRNMRFTKSGNYVLKVFDDDNNGELVLTRRFMVVEPQWLVEAQFVRTAKVSKFNTHHEIDFVLHPHATNVQRPREDIKAYVLQNGRWDNAIGPLQPNFIRSNELVYDYQDKITFPAGKEWRFFDMRSFEFSADNIAQVNALPNFFDVILTRDLSRVNAPYIYRADLNGRFSIENRNYNQTIDQCDYARVLFTLEHSRLNDDVDVYVFGELSDWKLSPEFRMDYNEEAGVYFCEPFLKQGYYNYNYVVVDRTSKEPVLEGMEGNWYETDNLYTILVYFRPFGQRYDRLMCAVSLNSGIRN